jgi:hypothetical protein
MLSFLFIIFNDTVENSFAKQAIFPFECQFMAGTWIFYNAVRFLNFEATTGFTNNQIIVMRVFIVNHPQYKPDRRLNGTSVS